MKKVELKKTKFFWLYFVVAILLLALDFFIFPLWKTTDVKWANLGQSIIYIIIAVFLASYLCLYLIKKVTDKKKNVIQILTIFEFVILSVIAIFCIISLFIKEFAFLFTVSRILGLSLFMRGVVGSFEGYYYKNEDDKKYPVGLFVLDIFLISLGTYVFTSPIISDEVILWIFCILIIIISVFLIACGITLKPKKNKEEKKYIEKD